VNACVSVGRTLALKINIGNKEQGEYEDNRNCYPHFFMHIILTKKMNKFIVLCQVFNNNFI
jgi:hypothetical protein